VVIGGFIGIAVAGPVGAALEAVLRSGEAQCSRCEPIANAVAYVAIGVAVVIAAVLVVREWRAEVVEDDARDSDD
jgi:hypothetical protein